MLASHRSRLSKKVCRSPGILGLGRGGPAVEEGGGGRKGERHGTHSGSLPPRSSPLLPAHPPLPSFASPFNLPQLIFPQCGQKKKICPVPISTPINLVASGPSPIFITGGRCLRKGRRGIRSAVLTANPHSCWTGCELNWLPLAHLAFSAFQFKAGLSCDFKGA